MAPTKQINILALTVLLAGLIITALSWRYTQRTIEDHHKQEFEWLAIQAEDALSRRIREMTEVLQGVRTVFYLQPHLSRAEFRHMVYRNGFLDRYPGIQVVGYIRMVTAGHEADYEEAVRSDRSIAPTGYRHFSIHPPGRRSDYYVITYVEPMVGNEKALGFDIGSEPVRRSAMEMARDSGRLAATGGITLVQETGTQAGLLLMAPLYAEGTPLQTVELRQRAFQGLVYLGLRVGDILYKAFNGRFLDRIDLQIFGVSQPGEDPGKPLLFDSRATEQAQQADRGLSRESLLDIGGRKWRLVFSEKGAAFGTDQALPMLVLLSGVVISLLLFWLVRTLGNSKRRATALADQMTRQLRDSELRSRTVLDNVLDGIISINEQGIVESFNRAAERIFGYPAEEVIGRNVKMLMPEPYHSQHDLYLGNYISSGVPKIIGIGSEVVGLRKDGTIFPMDLAVTETWLEGRHIFTGIARDISLRKQAEDLISRTSRLNQAILDGADYSIIATDTDGVILTFNRGAEKMLGYTANELVGKFTPALLHDMHEVQQRALELTAAGIPVEPGFEVFVAVARQGKPDTNEWSYVRKDGSRFPVLLTVTALRDEHGDVTGFLGIARDITEQKKAAQELRESSESVARAQQIAHFGNWDWNIETGSLRWSDEMYRIFGLQPQEFSANYEAFLQAVHPDDRELVRNAVNSAIVQRTPYCIEHRVVLPDGSERTVHEQGEAFFNDEGKPVRMLGTVQDITERKRFEDELQKLSRAVEQSPVSVVITDSNANIEYVNAKFSEVTGYSLAEVSGKNSRILQSGLMPIATYQAMWQTLLAGGEWRGQLRNRKKNGELFWEEVYISAIRNHDGAVTHFIGVKEDITERVRIEEELGRAGRRNDMILSAIGEGIYGVDLESNTTFINPAGARMLGYAPEDLVGRPQHPITHHTRSDGSLYPADECKIYSSYRDGKTFHVSDEVFWRKDGTSFPVEYVSTPVHEEGKIVGAVVSFRDITERLHVDLMKNEFISTVSHELRTPLTSIRGSLGLIAGGVAGELPAQAKVLVEIAHKNSERLITLVNDILDIEKIESGKMQFDMKPQELVPLIEQALEVNRAYGDQFNVAFMLERPQRAVTVDVDAGRLMQVMANLLSNAAKFSPAGGTVNVSVQCSENRVRISVSDRGQGIPEEFRGKIFQKFSQADSSDTRKKGGTGLGLSITKAIVEQMGGSIGFDSQPNVLTTFFIEFPEWKETAAPATVEREARVGKVLICEADRDIAMFLRLMLEQDGLQADIANDAEQARQMLAQGGYTAMTLGLALPDQDGVALIRELRESEATADLPVVVVSAQAVEGREEWNVGTFNVIDWIVKPINRSHLKLAVRHAVKQVSRGRARVLHVEDDLDIFLVVNGIVGEVADLDHAATLAEAKQLLGHGSYDLAILDLGLPDGSGTELLPLLNSVSPPVPVLIFSALDMAQDGAQEVASALVKSHASNEMLLATIKQLIARK